MGVGLTVAMVHADPTDSMTHLARSDTFISAIPCRASIEIVRARTQKEFSTSAARARW